ncbi:MAG: hypothetical protein ABSE04_02520 [Candidatus Microgenomates bacterium]|jgi:hypothetical protein
MNIKLLAASFIALGSIASFNTRVFSQSPTTATKAGLLSGARMTIIKTRADGEITARLNSLNEAITRIGAVKRLTDDQKNTFTTEVQTDITNLSALKTKIDADSDLPTLTADAKSLFTDYRVYAVFLPQIHEIISTDIIQTAATNLTAIAGKLQTRITALQTSGKSVSDLQGFLNDMNAKISDAQSQATAALNEIVNLTPSSYPGSATPLKDARTKIKTATSDLKAAVVDAKLIVAGLK